MADIRIKDLPLATGPTAPSGTDVVAIDGLTTRKTTITALGDVAVPVASQAEAEAGSNASKRMTPLTTKQSIASQVGITLATAAQGALADSAVQPGDLGNSASRNVGTTAGTVAAGDDSRIVGALQPLTLPTTAITIPGGSPRSLISKLSEISFSPRDFDPTGVAGTGGDDTAFVQAAINAAEAVGGEVNLNGMWRVSTVNVGLGANLINIIGRAYLVGIASSPTPALMIFHSNKFTLSGHILVDGQWSANYSYGWWGKGSPNLQFVNFINMMSNRVPIGFKIGDEANPNALISEIVVIGGGNYSCPVVCLIVGTETYVSIVAPMRPSDSASGDAAWAAMVKRGVICKGAFVKISTGELIQAGSASILDYIVDLQPLNKINGDLQWGEVELDNVHVETGGPLAIINNPSGLTGTVVNGGLFRVEGCSGYHSQDLAPFVKVVNGSGFTGDIVEAGNSFRCPVVRTNADVEANNNACTVYLSNKGFGKNFKNSRAGVTGSAVTIIGADGGKPIPYTPSAVSGAGAITTSVTSGSYYRVGKLVHFYAKVDITANGTGAGNVLIGLPVPVAAGKWLVAGGRENALTGKALTALAGGGGTSAATVNYDNTYPGGTGASIIVSGFYEGS